MARVLNSGLLRRRRRSGGGVQTIVSDTFTRADNAASLGVADTGQAWTSLGGTWGISGNQAYCPTAALNPLAVVDSGKADCSVQATLTVVAGIFGAHVGFR